jgi:hypothetical protein
MGSLNWQFGNLTSPGLSDWLLECATQVQQYMYEERSFRILPRIQRRLQQLFVRTHDWIQAVD